MVVGARSQWSPSHVDQNVLRFDHFGRLVDAATFGDGIQHIATTHNGLTWVGYFDEGVIGNYGWGSPGPRPIGEHGINCFDTKLRLLTSARGFEILDCYAMNVTSESLHACCYTDWKIRRLDPAGNEVTWDNSVKGARAMVVAGANVALIGAHECHDLVAVGALEDEKFKPYKVDALTLSGEALRPGHLATRGNALHALIEGRWYCCDLDHRRTR